MSAPTRRGSGTAAPSPHEITGEEIHTEATTEVRQPAGSLSKLGSGVFKARDLDATARSRRQPVVLPLCRAVSAAAPYLPPEVLAELERAVGRAVAGLLGVDLDELAREVRR